MKTSEVLDQLDKIKVMVNSNKMTTEELIEAFNSLDSIVRGQYQLLDEYQEMIDEKKTFIDKLTHVNTLLTDTSLAGKREIDSLRHKIIKLEVVLVGSLLLTGFLVYNIISAISF